MKDFRKLEIWNKGMDLVKEIYCLTEKLPNHEKYGLISQMQRSAVSIPSNIAEGCSRNSEIEFKRFLEFSIGSSFELETQLLVSVKLNYVSNEDLESILTKLNTLQKQLNALIAKIANSQ